MGLRGKFCSLQTSKFSHGECLVEGPISEAATVKDRAGSSFEMDDEDEVHMQLGVADVGGG